MRGLDICKVWSRVPGLNDYWCQQIQWRISKDDELIGALTEPRYPCADDSLDTIILTQTVHLCQLFLHLQEFDPCATDTANSAVPNEELLCVFQDTLAREFNFAYDDRDRAHAGPAPVGEALERLVRGLMLAQRQEPQPQASTTTTSTPAPPPPTSSAAPHRAQLQALLVRILRELNEPVDKHPLRYEQAYGPRRDDTWAARFATRIMQWRFTVKYAPESLVEEVIEVQRHDVHPLDDEGLEVYRILRCTAPGLIHIVTPLHPETMQPQPQQSATQAPSYSAETQQQQQPPTANSTGMKVQQMLGTPLAQTPGSSASEGTDTPRTTPQFPQLPSTQAESGSNSSIKRGSEDEPGDTPPLKRPRPAETVAAPSTDEIVVRGGPMDIDTPEQPQPPPPRVTAEETNALLRRAVEGIMELGKKIDGMQMTMDQRLGQLDEKLNKIFEWVGSED
ncbi:hypothetical protein N0V82_006735 [Gnomoniopsis sp. IMI 355080]|nr:hypothetical protein N0V82_006735 [Gnomoniopsis sp. IMI 355080]